MLRLTIYVILVSCPLILTAQTCTITNQNANQDFCTACSGNITDGQFTGSLDIQATYTISASCINTLTWGGTINIMIGRRVDLTFGADPYVEPNTTVTATFDNKGQSGDILVFGQRYEPKGKNGNSFADFEIRMETEGANNRSSLPVELLSWTADRSDDRVVLHWSTLTESYNDYFRVEYSTDGTAFHTIAQINGAGTTDTEQHYQTSHRPAGNTTVYYRLRQVDIDGTATVYGIQTVVTAASATDFLYPNPVRAGALLTIGGSAATPRAELYNSSGQRLLVYPLNAGTNRVRIPARLPAGLYLLRTGAGSRRLAVR